MISLTACRPISQHVTATFYANNQIFSSGPLCSRPSRTRSFYNSNIALLFGITITCI